MKRNILIGILVLVLAVVALGVLAEEKETTPELAILQDLNEVGLGFYSITLKEISQHIWFYSGPVFDGRRNGTEGNIRAGRFLMEEFKSYYLDKEFFQNFSFSEIKNPQHGRKIADYLYKIGFEVSENGRNVVGILEGTDKKDEYVVISAHYDHMGINQNGEVFWGADDNASGVAALLEIAEAFGILAQEELVRPRRSIVFVLFDAEEMGLWGSQYFVENSPVPFEKIVTLINLDMIGRNEPDKLKIIGSEDIKDFPEKSPQLYQATIRANKIFDFELIYPSDFIDGRRAYMFFRSDQFSFFSASPENNRLPVVFYYGGLHEDYHTPADTADKINFEKVQNIARFSFFVAWQIANLEERPVYQNQKEKDKDAQN